MSPCPSPCVDPAFLECQRDALGVLSMRVDRDMVGYRGGRRAYIAILRDRRLVKPPVSHRSTVDVDPSIIIKSYVLDFVCQT